MFATQKTLLESLSGFITSKSTVNYFSNHCGSKIFTAKQMPLIIFFLVPPRIVEEVNITLPIKLKEGVEFSLPCLVEGNPKPIVLWKKNDLPVLNQQSGKFKTLMYDYINMKK